MKKSGFGKLSLAALLLFAFVFGAMPSAYAQGPAGGTIPTGTRVEDDVFIAESGIVVDGDVAGDLFAVGSSITINGNVNGSVFLVGEQVMVRGKISGSAYVLATNFATDSTAVLDRSVYAIVANLNTIAGAQITRDLNTLAIGARLAGNVGRNTRAIIGPLEIIRLFARQVESLQLISQNNVAPARVTAPAVRNDSRPPICRGPVAISGSVLIGVLGMDADCVAPVAQPEPAENTALQDAGGWAIRRVLEFVTLFVIGALVVWLLPKQLVEWRAPVALHPVLAGAVGMLVAVNGFIFTGVFLAAVTAVGFAAMALHLNGLAWPIWGLGYAAVGVFFWLFFLLLYYVSQVVVALWGGAWLLKRFAPKTQLHVLVPLALGLAIFVVLAALPVLGALFSTVVSLIGAGAVVLSGRERWSGWGKRNAVESKVKAAA